MKRKFFIYKEVGSVKVVHSCALYHYPYYIYNFTLIRNAAVFTFAFRTNDLINLRHLDLLGFGIFSEIAVSAKTVLLLLV